MINLYTHVDFTVPVPDTNTYTISSEIEALLDNSEVHYDESLHFTGDQVRLKPLAEAVCLILRDIKYPKDFRFSFAKTCSHYGYDGFGGGYVKFNRKQSFKGVIHEV